MERKRKFDGKFQKALNDQDEIVHTPIMDRYLTNIYEYVDKDEFKQATASPYTEIYGSGLSYALTDLENYLFIAALYGSYTHLHTARRAYVYILDHYSEIHDDTSLRFEALKQHILIGESRNFELYLEKYWDLQYASLASNADELWMLADNTTADSRSSMKLILFAHLGLYMSDAAYQNAELYIWDFATKVYRLNSEIYFDAILKNLGRMNANRVLDVIIPIIAEHRYSVGQKISSIIMKLPLERVSKRNLKRLAEVLAEKAIDIIHLNGDPQMLAVLINHDYEIFGSLEKTNGMMLLGIQETIYRINRKEEKMDAGLKKAIELAHEQFEKNNQEGMYSSFAINPYRIIQTILRKEPTNNNIEKLILEDFIPLGIEVLNSKAAIQEKIPCAACLCEILGYMNKKSVKLPAELKQALLNFDIEKGTDFSQSGSRKILELRVMTAKVMVGIDEITSLLRWCYEYEDLNTKEKICMIDCLEKYLFYKDEQSGELDSLFLSIILQCSSENNAETRALATRCLAYITKESGLPDIIMLALNKAVYDPSELVRMTMLHLCKNKILPPLVSINIMKALRNDKNYEIRTLARKRT